MTDAPSVDLLVRSLGSGEAARYRETVLRHLDRLAARERIEGYSLLVCGDAVDRDARAAGTGAGRVLSETLEAVEAWADAPDRSVDSFFPTVERESAFAEETRRETRLPAVALVEYDHAGSVRAVSPALVDGSARTVADRLDALAGDGRTATDDRPFTDDRDAPVVVDRVG